MARKSKSLIQKTKSALNRLERVHSNPLLLVGRNNLINRVLRAPKRAIAARSARLSAIVNKINLDYQLKKLSKVALRKVERLRQSRPPIKPVKVFKPQMSIDVFLALRRFETCKKRKERHHAIMAKTQGKGMKVKFAQWTARSRIKC